MDQHLNYKYSNDHVVEVFVRHNKQIKIDPAVFESISIRYESPECHYFIAKINLQQIMNSDWISDPDISIILTENNT
jgi:hypothetical protein